MDKNRKRSIYPSPGLPDLNMDLARKILVFCFVLSLAGIKPLIAQDSLTVHGTVLQKPGDPAQDVTIGVEGSDKLPVVTDSLGRFTLTVPVGDEWIMISPAGHFKKQRIFLNNRKELTVYLTPDDLASGQDKISILSQTMDKRNIIASFSSLNTKDLHQTSDLTVDQFMQGRVPGMYVINRSGAPGSGSVTNIRGIHSINSSNQPLYVIDGIPLLPFDVFGSKVAGFAYNPLLILNPLDISKTTIVTDPVINSAYGSRGSNGVVYIETLDPSVTRTTIDFDYRGGYLMAPQRLIPQMDAAQHKSFISEMLYSSPMYEEEIKLKYPNLFLEPTDDGYIDYQHNTNWQNLIFSNGFFNNINIKVKGGDEIARYGLSFGYLNGQGIIKHTRYNGYNFRFVSQLNIFKWLKMNAGVALNYSSGDLKEAATNEQTSPIMTSLAKSPMLGPYQYDINGNQINVLSEVDELGISNPMAVIQNYSANNNNYCFITNLNLKGTFNKYLSLNSAFSLNYNVLKEQIFMPNHGMEKYYDQEAINVAKGLNNSFNSFYNNTNLIFSRSFNNKNHLTSNTGFNIQTNKYQMDWGLTKNLQSNDQYHSLQNGQNDQREIGGENRNWNWISFYEHVNYAFMDKYLLNLSISLDGSSRIGDNADETIHLFHQPWGLFYSGGVAWRISSESFLKDVSWLQELKLRGTFGITGNDDIGEATATNWYQAIKYRETDGLYPAVIPNDRLTYEKVSQLDLGVDLSLLGNRITFKVDFFSSHTDNMLIYSPVEQYLGYSVRAMNGGQMKNTGMDFSSFFRIFERKSFKWDVSAIISKIKSEVTSMNGGKLVTDIPGGQIVNMPGHPANSYYGYIYKGVFATTQQANEAGLVNNRGIPFQAGDAIFEDLSGPEGTPDGVINDYDKTVIGSSMPDMFGGLTTTFTYKKWKLSTNIYFVKGNKIFNYLRYKNEQMYGLANQSARILNRWQYEGQQTDIPRAVWKDPVGNSDFSSRWIENGSYLRINNIILSYTIPHQLLIIKNIEIYVSANNLFVFSNYLGYDPEFDYSYSNITQGIDYGQMPQARQFIAGIKLGL